MKILNPFKNIVRKVYQYTFLRRVEVGITFAKGSVSPQIYWKAVQAFLSKYFPSVGDAKMEADLIGSLRITSSNKQIDFSFTDGAIGVTILHDAYNSYNESLLPAINILTDYLTNVVRVESVTSVSLTKLNCWPIQIQDGTKDYRLVVKYIFNGDVAKGFAAIEDLPDNVKNQPFKLSRETELPLGKDARLKGRIAIEFKNPLNFNVFLKCTTLTPGMPTEEITSALSDLNDVQYGFYHDMVSSDIVELMEKGGRDE